MKTLILLTLLCLTTTLGFSQSSSDSLLKIYDRYWELSPGIYRVMKNGAVGVAGSKGILVPVEYQQVWSLSDKGYFRVIKNGKTGLYHIDKGIIIPAEYDQIWDFHQGMARVIKDGKVGYYGMAGEVIAPCLYQQIWDFNNGLARVVKDGKLGYITQSGQEVIPCIYQQIGDFKNGMARVVRDGKMGYITNAGIEIIPCDYQQIWDFNNGLAKVVKNGRIGFINETGKEIIPPVYSQIWDFEGDSARAVLNGNLLYINAQGKVISSNGGIKLSETPDASQLPVAAETPQQVSEIPAIPSTNADTTRTIRIGKNKISIITNDGVKTIEYDNNENNENEGEETHHKKHKGFKGHLFGVDLGFNNYMTKDNSTSLPVEYNFMELNSSKSVGTTIHVVQESFNINHKGSVGIVTGVGIEFNNYRFDSQYLLTKTDMGTITYQIAAEKVDKNKLTSVYGTIPVLFEIQGSKRYTDHPAYISAGVVGGVRLKSYTKVTYNNGNKDKTRGSFNLQDFRYGIMARAGYKFINLYGVYYPMPLFKNSQDPELYPFTIGFSFLPDWM